MKKLLRQLTLFMASLSLLGCTTIVNNKDAYITTTPRTDYNVGDVFTTDGIEIIDVSNGSPVTSYTTSYNEGYVFTSNDVGIRKVTVKPLGYKELFYNITVYNLPALELSGTYKTVYEYGEYFSLAGLVVKSNGKTISNYSCNFSTENRLTTPGTFKVVISKEGYFSAEYNITVRAVKQLRITSLPNKTNYTVGEAFSLDGMMVKDEYNSVVTDYTCSIEDGSILKYAGKDIEVTVSKDNYGSDSFTIDVESAPISITKSRDINIYYLNDTHGSYSRYDNGSKSEGGMSYIGRYLKDIKKEDPENTFIFSGGDMFEGGYESNTTKGQIMIEAMNEIGFDVMALGNHEFSWGSKIMEDMITALDCPVLSCNTFNSNRITKPSYLKDCTVITRGDLTVGVIGAIREGIASSITGKVANEFYFDKPNEYVKSLSTELRLSYNCDLVLYVCHDEGFDSDSETQPTKYLDITGIDAKTGSKYVDGMFFAHDHYSKSGYYQDVPFIESSANGILIGKMSFSLEGSSIGYSVKNQNVTQINAFRVCTSTDSEIEKISNKYAEIVKEGASVVTTFKVSHDKTSIVNIILAAMIWYTNNNPDEFFNTEVHFASHNIGGVRVSMLYAGPVSMKALIKAYPFENFMTIQTCNSSNIAYMSNSTYYQTLNTGLTYDSKGKTKAVSINYISDSSYYGPKCQESYKTATLTAQQALIAYLKAGVDNTL